MLLMRPLLLAVIAVLLVADGYVHGLWTGRWQTSHELEQAVARLPSVPMSIGDWQAEARTLPERHAEIAGFSGYLLRTYRNRQDGSVVNVLLACGPPGPLSVHTPEVCFVGAGFEPLEQAKRVDLRPAGAGGGAEFWKASYGKSQSVAPERLRVFWSWHARGTWQVPDNPRWTFAGLPVIDKLYVTWPLNGSMEESNDVVQAKFMEAFLAAVDKSLFATP
jgi:Protein of unknown function (DUF3485)